MATTTLLKPNSSDIPQWQEGEPRRIDVEQWRVTDLVGEVGDTTLATESR